MRRWWIVGALVALTLGACGSDDDDKADVTTATVAETTPAQGSLPAVPDELCALAKQMYEQDDFPSAAQLQQYKTLAPPEIAAQVNLAADKLLATNGDTVALFNAFGAADVEAAVADIDAWEELHCNIPHSTDEALPAGSSQDIEPTAKRVDVTASEFAFTLGPVSPGRTSFVLTNKGVQAHILVIFKLADGVTLEQALAAEGDESKTDGQWSTQIAAAGETEAVTFDAVAGRYGLICFLPDADGVTSHADRGMKLELTVA